MANSAMTTSARMSKIKASQRSAKIDSSFKEAGVDMWGTAGPSPVKEGALGKLGRSLPGKLWKDGSSKADFTQQLRAEGEMTGHFNGRLPDASSSDTVVKQMFEKLCSGDQWQDRVVVVTHFDVLFARIGETHVIDSIPIHEVEDVTIDQTVADHPQIRIDTSPTGYNSGRPYVLRVSPNIAKDARTRSEMADDFSKKLKAAHVESFRRMQSRQRFAKYQQTARRIYTGKPVQILIACLIVANFVFSAVEAQIKPLQQQPPNYSLQETFNRAEVTFTIVFLVELIINMGCHGREFYSNSWNLFDLVVVTISLVSLAENDIPGINVLRLLRAFRVLRLFGRLGAQRRIINAISSSALPVVNALIIVVLVMCIYAIMGVEFFGTPEEQGGWGAVEFDTFSDALFTMFQVATFEGWADIARPLFGNGGKATPLVAVFFTTYIALISWILLPVVVALLLDNFSTMALMEQQNQKENERQLRNAASSSLDPLLAKLALFKTEEELESRILILYRILDVDQSQGLSYTELSEGLKKLNFTPGIHLSREDFDLITLKGAMCDEENELDVERFGQVMKHQLRLFVERNLSSAMQGLALDEGGNDGCAVVSSLKMVMMQLNRLEDEVKRVRDERVPGPPCPHCGIGNDHEQEILPSVTYGLEAHPSKRQWVVDDRQAVSQAGDVNSASRQNRNIRSKSWRSKLSSGQGDAQPLALNGLGTNPSVEAPNLNLEPSATLSPATPHLTTLTPAHSSREQVKVGGGSPSRGTPRSDSKGTPRERMSLIVPLPKASTPKSSQNDGGRAKVTPPPSLPPIVNGGGGSISRPKPMGAAFELAMSGGLKNGSGGGVGNPGE